MSFLDRVKKLLIKNNEQELANIEQKIRELEQVHSKENEIATRLREESQEVSREKSSAQKRVMSEKELEELENIYHFVANYSKIKKVTGLIGRAASLTSYVEENSSFDAQDEEVAFIKERNYREHICGIVTELNEKISEILANEEEQTKKEETRKKGFLNKIFGKNTKNNPKKEKISFNRYRKTIEDFKSNYSAFLVVNVDGPKVVDKIISSRFMLHINNLMTAQKRGLELTKDDEEYLRSLEPHELWKAIYKYYLDTELIVGMIRNFDKNIDKFEELYKERPELFDIKNLERIFQENNRLVLDLRRKNQVASDKREEFVKKRQEEKEIKAQLKVLQDKKKKVEERTKKVREAKSIKELGYKSKEDATKKLSMDTKDYIIIPISKGIGNIEELFFEEKRLKVQIDGRTFFTTYANDVATGKINSIDYDQDVTAALMIPIKGLKKENIDGIKSGKISISKSVLQQKNLMAVIPQGREIDFGDANIEIQNYTSGNIVEHVKSFFGEDYAIDSDEIDNYEIFKGVSSISSKEKRAKREAVVNCVIENLKRDVGYTDTIHVNGKPFFINKDDERQIRETPKVQPLDEQKLFKIADDIANYIIGDSRSSLEMDAIYHRLLREYMRVNRKTKSDYYEEDNTTVMVKDRKMSIKPILPAKDEYIGKRYARESEDIIYKTMKLAVLVNKFAHMTETPELQKALFEAKLDLIENAIDLSKDNPNIKLKRKFDQNKMAMSVVLEIPGYNMVSLHLMNTSNSLSYKVHRLEEHEEDVFLSSILSIPGVNKELLVEMRNMSEEERIQFLISMDSAEFYKLAIRMGYTSENMSSEKSRRLFIKKMTSNQKIDELLGENEELEK